MKIIQKLRLSYRAKQYLKKENPAGIKYLLDNVGAGDTVFEIGAHKGAHLYFIMQKLGGTGKAYAFEPQSTLFTYLAEMKALMGWKNLQLERLALSDEKIITPIYDYGLKNSHSGIGASITEFPNLESVKLEEVITQTLDDYCNRHDIRPSFIRIDVEGNEMNLLRGAADTLQNCRPRILMEFKILVQGREKMLKTFNFIKSIGYKGYFFRNQALVRLSEFNFEAYSSQTPDYGVNNFIFEPE